MKRSALVLGMVVGVMSLVRLGEREASACGGCFHPPPPPTQVASDITDERMLLAVSPTQTTLYDQISYSGNPTSFAWVLPIRGTVDVGLSADVLFDSIDTLTATQIEAPAPDCPQPTCQGGANFGASTPSAGGGADNGAGSPGVTVTKQENVGPYETVQLHSTSSAALENWLTVNGFDIPAAVKPVVTQYVQEGFDFLAMKLLPNQGVSAMRPVRVTMQGALLSLPLRMAGVGTGAVTGITIWVVSDGRYEPQNFPFFHIEDSELVWDWNTNASNYSALRKQHEATYNGKGWELESSLDLNEQTISSVILSGGVYYGSGGGGGAAPAAYTADAGIDYLPEQGADGGAGESADQVRSDDVAALFAGMKGPNVRVTRIRSDIAHNAMTTDFTLQASPDQSEVNNVRTVTRQVNLQCPIYGSDCSIIGYGSPPQAGAAPGSPGASTGGTFACNTTSTSPVGGPIGLGAGVALVGLVISRMRRRRRGS